MDNLVGKLRIYLRYPIYEIDLSTQILIIEYDHLLQIL